MPVIEKKTRRKKRSDAERLRILRRWFAWLSMVILVLATMICLLTYQLIYMQEQLSKPTEPPKGQNFSTQETTTAPVTTAAGETAETTEAPSAT